MYQRLMDNHVLHKARELTILFIIDHLFGAQLVPRTGVLQLLLPSKILIFTQIASDLVYFRLFPNMNLPVS